MFVGLIGGACFGTIRIAHGLYTKWRSTCWVWEWHDAGHQASAGIRLHQSLEFIANYWQPRPELR